MRARQELNPLKSGLKVRYAATTLRAQVRLAGIEPA